MSRPCRMAHLKKFDNRLHLEPVKSLDHTKKYVTKEDTRVEGPFEFGEDK